MQIKPFDTLTIIVLLGNFNPLIFKPDWFAKNGVIGQEEADNADIEVIHPELVKFHLSWLTVLVEKTKFVAEVKQPPDIRIYDFVVKTFGELLIHTPVWSMGINKRVHFDVGSVEKRDEIGMTLAPPQAWGEWAPSLESKDDKARGGMMSLSMRQSVTDDRPSGFIQTRIEPSSHGVSLIFMEVNDHYSCGAPNEIEGSSQIVDLLKDRFEVSIQRSEWIIDQIMGMAK